jgi:hypothetical protein
LQRPLYAGNRIVESARGMKSVPQVVVGLDKVRLDSHGLLHAGNGSGVMASLIMDQTKQVQGVNILRVLLKNPSVKHFRIGQSAMLMMGECEI